MGRPQKQTVNYFPHYVHESRTKFILEDNWGNDGYAFWFKLLELLCKSDGHCYDCSSVANKKYLVAVMKLPEETVDEIISTLADLGKIDKDLWKKHKVIWCQTLIDNLQSLYAKRTVSIPQKPEYAEFSERKPDETEIKEEKTPLSIPKETPPPEQDEKPKRKKSTTKATPEEKKVNYAEFVRMTEAEHQKLVSAYGEEKTKRMIEMLDNYKGSKGKSYKSDYRAILSWVVEKANEEFSRKGDSNYGRFGSGREQNRQPTAPGEFKPSGGFKKQPHSNFDGSDREEAPVQDRTANATQM